MTNKIALITAGSRGRRLNIAKYALTGTYLGVPIKMERFRLLDTSRCEVCSSY